MRWLLLMAALFTLAPETGAAGFQDDSGQSISFGRPYGRIISLYAAHTENLFALGAGGQVIGVSRSASHPPAALAKPAFSHRDGVERFIAARPDLVLIRPMIFRGYRPWVVSLKRAGIAVISLQPAGAGELFRYWRRLGLIAGRPDAAEAMVGRFKAGLARLRGRIASVPLRRRPQVYFESIHRQMKTFAPGAMAIFVLSAAGGINAAPDARPVRASHIAAYGKERILARGKAIEVYLAQVGRMNRVNKARIMAEPGFGAIKAVRRGRVHLVPEELVSRPTLRLLKGAALIQSLLYPSLGRGQARTAKEGGP